MPFSLLLLLLVLLLLLLLLLVLLALPVLVLGLWAARVTAGTGATAMAAIAKRIGEKWPKLRDRRKDQGKDARAGRVRAAVRVTRSLGLGLGLGRFLRFRLWLHSILPAPLQPQP